MRRTKNVISFAATQIHHYLFKQNSVRENTLFTVCSTRKDSFIRIYVAQLLYHIMKLNAILILNSVFLNTFYLKRFVTGGASSLPLSLLWMFLFLLSISISVNNVRTLFALFWTLFALAGKCFQATKITEHIRHESERQIGIWTPVGI